MPAECIYSKSVFNSNFSIPANTLKIVIYEMAAILFKTQYVDSIDSGLDHLC